MHVTVDVWAIDLARAATPSAAECDLLSNVERDRLARYLAPEPARIFATTRIALRRLLAAWLVIPAAAIRFETGPHGKPAVAGDPSVNFSVSHTSRSALIACCSAAPVGIDIEECAVGEFDGLAETICAPRERSWILSEGQDRHASITRLWTRKEAVLKSCGLGLSRGMQSLDLGALDASSGTCMVDGIGRIAWRDLNMPVFAAVAVFDDRVSSVGIRFRSHDMAREGAAGADPLHREY